MVLNKMFWHGGPACVEGEVAVEDEVENLGGGGEGAVGGQEDVDEGGLELARVRRQRLHQPLQRPRLQEPHAHRLPLQV